ncbi:MAG TPA: PAS domain-containing protein [Vicinamibacterales bacterium]
MEQSPSEKVPEHIPLAGLFEWSGLKGLVEQEKPAKLLRFLEGQSHLLEMIARSVPLPAVLEELTRVLEGEVEGMASSILLLSEDRKRLILGVAPSLPETFRKTLDGSAIGPRAGSCGAAAFLARSVIVNDIANDPVWSDYRQAALDARLSASWSTPILSGSGEVLGTIAMYHWRPFAPSPLHFSLIDLAIHLARIAIERDRVERDRERLWDAKRFAERYRMVLEATKDVIWEWNLENGDIHWNHGLADLGYESKDIELTVDWWTERIHNEDVDRVRRSVQLAIDSGNTLWDEEYRFRRKSGTYAYLLARALIVRDEAGKAVRLVGSLQNITGRKRHEQEAKDLAERFQSATVAAAVGTWRLDVKTQLVLADASLSRLVGAKEEETVRRFSDTIRVVHPEDRARVVQALDESIATGRPYESDHRVVLPEGEIRWIRSRGRVLFDKQGHPDVVTGAVADITELKYAEQSMAILADASRLLTESLDSEQILSSMARMAVPAFADGAVVHLKDQSTGEPRIAVVHAADPELLAAVREMQRRGTFQSAAPTRRVLQTGRGEVHPRWTADWLIAEDVSEATVSLVRRFHISSTIHVPIESEGQTVGVMVFAATGTRVYNERDLAFAEELARRASHAMHNAHLFQEAKVQRQRAEEAAALRERLVAIVGHDLRNPLSAISMAAQILSRSGLPPQEEKLVTRIQASASRMTRLIAQVLDFARIRAGIFTLKFTPSNLHQICNAVVDELRLSKPDQQIEVDLAGDGEVLCDADRMAQVLCNLLINAIQHGTRGPVSVTMRDRPPDGVTIEVHNSGPPIPGRLQAVIFNAFRLEADRGGRESESIGLGLFITQEIVREHGGTITVQSPDRDGTTFTIVLPRKPVTERA